MLAVQNPQPLMIMKRFITLLALAASFAFLTPVPAQARDGHGHGRSFHGQVHRHPADHVGHGRRGHPKHGWQRGWYRHPPPRYYHYPPAPRYYYPPGYDYRRPGVRLELRLFPRLFR